MKTEWLQNDHRQSVGSTEDLYLAGSCTLPMDWWVAGPSLDVLLIKP